MDMEEDASKQQALKENMPKLLMIGSVAFETKIYEQLAVTGTDSKFRKDFEASEICDTIGGSGLLCAIAARSLGCNVSLIAHLGADNHGKRLLKLLEQIVIEHLGPELKDGTTLRFVSSFRNGHLKKRFHYGVNTEGTIGLVGVNWDEYPIIILGYSSIPTFEQVASIAKSSNSICVANLSESVLQLPEHSLSSLRDFAIVSMNSQESEALASRLGYNTENIHEFFIGSRTVLCVTSRNGATVFIDGKSVATGKARPIALIDDAGAGDAFATAFAVNFQSRSNLKQCLEAALDLSAFFCTLKDKLVVLDLSLGEIA